MALATFVKVSGVNNLSDARYCAGMEVNELGFNIEPDHANYIAPQDFKEISDWVSGIEYVGEIESSGNLAELIKDYPLDAIEVHQAHQIQEALNTGLKVILRTNDLSVINGLDPSIKEKLHYMIFDGAPEAALANQAILVTEGFDAENVKDIIEEHGLKGIAMQGGNEIRPGFKDFDELADLLEALDVDEFV